MDELIVKCLLGEASPEEEALLQSWLKVSEDNRAYYESFRYAYDVTAAPGDIEPEVEWRHFQRAVRPKYWHALAIAASVLLIIITAWPEKQSIKPLVQQKSITRHKLTTSKQHRLPDGSTVWLRGELCWQESFNREVTLIGAAKFAVSKDSIHPFTVQCNKFSVTVLGTVFTVDEQSVRLYEGKVMVEALGKKYYLIPGQEFMLEANKVTVRKFIKTNTVQPIDDIPLPYHDRGNWYMFNNQSLSQVFDQLKQIYEVDIVYNEADLQKMYFIGRFGRSDSVESILRQIATLNHLTVVKENDRYIISK